MSFYEATAVAIMYEAVRVAFFPAAGSRTGAMDTGNGLFGRWVCEVADAVAGINLSNAYDLLNILVSKIDTTQAPSGKKFQECYDLKTLSPSKEYLDLYNKVKREIEDLGIAFK